MSHIKYDGWTSDDVVHDILCTLDLEKPSNSEDLEEVIDVFVGWCSSEQSCLNLENKIDTPEGDRLFQYWSEDI